MNEVAYRLGILGGTFDPIHYGHLNTAQDVLQKAKLDQIHFIPAPNPPHREPPEADPQDRLTMTRLALKDYPKFVLDDREYRLPEPSYTVNTLESFHEEGLHPFLIIGEDSLHGFNRWHRWQDILELAHLLVMQRPHATDQLGEDAPAWTHGRIRQDIDQLQAEAGGMILMLEITPSPVSATEIRRRIKTGKDISGMTPPPVCDYIRQHQLYQ